MGKDLVMEIVQEKKPEQILLQNHVKVKGDLLSVLVGSTNRSGAQQLAGPNLHCYKLIPNREAKGWCKQIAHFS